MRRTMITAASSLAVLATTAVPAMAVESEKEAGTYGSFEGVIVGLVIGFIFALVVVVLANRDVSFGEDTAHADEAHDIRSGVGEHDVEVPPSDQAQHTESHAP